MARMYLFPVPLGHHLHVPKGKYHIPVGSFCSFCPKHSWTVLWISYSSLCIRTKSLKNEVGALCWPQQTLNQALLQSKDGFILQRDSTYQNHTKIQTVTQKNKWFLIKQTQICITFFTQIFPLNHYWEGRWGESLHPQNSHVLLFPWEILLREVLQGANYSCVTKEK